MTDEEFAEAYQEHRDRLLRHITRRGGVDDDTAAGILGRAMYGRPTRTRGVSGGMYAKRQEIPKADFLKYAYKCANIEIRDWYREHKREVSFTDLAFQDKGGQWNSFDPSTHQGLDPVKRAERPTCPPNLVTCPDCDEVLKPQPISTLGSLCSCGLGIAAGIEPRYRPPRGNVLEPQNCNIDEDHMFARMVAQLWGDSLESALTRLGVDHQELLRRLVMGEWNVIYVVLLAGLKRVDGHVRIVIEEKWAELGGEWMDSPRVGGVETLEAVAADWQFSSDVVLEELELATKSLKRELAYLSRPRIDWRTGRRSSAWPPVPPCARHSLDKSSPGQEWRRCQACGEILSYRADVRRKYGGTRWTRSIGWENTAALPPLRLGRELKERTWEDTVFSDDGGISGEVTVEGPMTTGNEEAEGDEA